MSVVVRCDVCGNTVEIEGRPPERVLCPRCGSVVLDLRVAGASETLPVKSPERKTPRRLGDYEIISEIRRGAMGVVYRARQRKVDRVVALKVLLAGEHASEEQVERFMRETRAVAQLTHPNIVPLYDVGFSDGFHFFAMELVGGRSLDVLLARKGSLSVEEAVSVAKQVAAAIAHAHAKGIVHRDIKPANILLDDEGNVRVTDFGLAKELQAEKAFTRSGVTIGTPHYMSPEQARGRSKDVDERSDVYSLGAVFYEMLTGRAPFEGETAVDVILSVLEDEPPPLRKLKPNVPRELETIILKAMQKDPARRYRTVREMLDDIERFERGEPISARPSGVFRRVVRRLSRRAELVAAALVVLALVLGALAYARYERARRQEQSRMDERRREEERRRKKQLQERLERMARRKERWQTAFAEHFTEDTIGRWRVDGKRVGPLDGALLFEPEPRATVRFAEPLGPNVRVRFQFRVDDERVGAFEVFFAALENESGSGYAVRFRPGGVELFKKGRLCTACDVRIPAYAVFDVELLRDGDVVRVTLNDEPVIDYRDYRPLTGADRVWFGFTCSGMTMRVGNMRLMKEVLPAEASPLCVAHRLFMNGAFDAAAVTYRSIISSVESQETRALALYWFGVSTLYSGKRAEAVGTFRDVCANFSGTDAAALAGRQLALIALEDGRYEEFHLAARESRGLLDVALAEADYGVLEGYISWRQKRLKRLKKDDEQGRRRLLEELIVLERRLPRERRKAERLAGNRYALAGVLERQGLLPEAEANYRRAADAAPHPGLLAMEALVDLARLQALRGDYEAALLSLQQWLQRYDIKRIEEAFLVRVGRPGQQTVKLVMDGRFWSVLSRYPVLRARCIDQLLFLYAQTGRYRQALAFLARMESRNTVLVGGAEKVQLNLTAGVPQARVMRSLWRMTLLLLDGDEEAALHAADEAARAAPGLRTTARVLAHMPKSVRGDLDPETLLRLADAAEFLGMVLGRDMTAEETRKRLAGLVGSRGLFGEDSERISTCLRRGRPLAEYPPSVSKSGALYHVLLAALAHAAGDALAEQAVLQSIPEDASPPPLRFLSRLSSLPAFRTVPR